MLKNGVLLDKADGIAYNKSVAFQMVLISDTRRYNSYGQREKSRADHRYGGRLCPVVYGCLRQGGARGLLCGEGPVHHAPLWLRHLGEHHAYAGPEVQGNGS